MVKLHEIKFCWLTKLPAKFIYNKEEHTLTTNKVRLLAESHTDMLKRLKGTNPKLISNINSIKECTP